MTVKAIETTYAGHHFRSRLEARWAVFFDHLGITWQYEPQGFVVSDYAGAWNYLPDFYLPELDVWVEVKGDPRAVKWEMLATSVDGWAESGLPPSRHAYSGNCPVRGSGHPCQCGGCGSAIVILGEIPRFEDNGRWVDSDVSVHYAIVNAKAPRIQGASFTDSGAIDFAYQEIGYYDSTWGGNATVDWLPGYHRPDALHEARASVGPDQTLSKVRKAYAAARKARFEHGRQG